MIPLLLNSGKVIHDLVGTTMLWAGLCRWALTRIMRMFSRKAHTIITGCPFGLLALLRYDASRHSPLVGYAADGYPIYALTGILDGQLTQVASSYVLKSGARPGGDAPTGDYDGAFVQDYEYVSEFGDLDTCNGAFTQSAEYPNGTYAYFLTPEFPFVPRCFTGTPDAGFKHGF